jgi:ribose/xylose/arabinose/galactoside ABC-type transport system permease subunit
MTVNDLDRPGRSFDPVIRFFKAPEWGLVAGILAVLTLIHFLDKDHAFFQAYSLKTLIHRVSLFGVLAVGAALVIIAGGIDLSTGAVVSLASVVSAKLLTEWLRKGVPAGQAPSVGIIGLTIGLTLLMGLAIGLFHAFMINGLRLPPFIATLATMAGLRSLATVLSESRTINVSYEAYRVWGSNPWYALSIFTIVAATMSVLMGCTVLGRHLFALGGNETAARLSGLRTRRLKAIAYGLSGTLSALGGILFTGLTGQADSRLGVTYELTAITAAVVGGCSLSGGLGSIRGTVLGLMLTQIVIKGTGIVVRGVDSTQIEGLVLGTVVVLAVAVNQRFRLRKE